MENEVKDIEFGRRLVFLRKHKNLSQDAASKEIDMGLSTLQQYEYGKIPGAKNTLKILSYYKCNRTWLLTGEGLPYPEKSDDLSVGEEIVAYQEKPHNQQSHLNNNNVLAMSTDRSPPQEFRISEALSICARVLESGTSYATALYLNIQHFDRAVAAEARIGYVEKSQKSLEVKFDELLGKVNNLQAENTELSENVKTLQDENKALRSEVNRLTATYEHPDSGDGHLTDTSTG